MWCFNIFSVISAKKTSYGIVGHKFQELHAPMKNWNISDEYETGWKCRIWEFHLRPKGQSYYGDKERLWKASAVGAVNWEGQGEETGTEQPFLKWVRKKGVRVGEIWSQDMLIQEIHIGPEKKLVVGTKLC